MISLLIACACVCPPAPEPLWNGDTLTLTSVWLYQGWDDTDEAPVDPGPQEADPDAPPPSTDYGLISVLGGPR